MGPVQTEECGLKDQTSALAIGCMNPSLIVQAPPESRSNRLDFPCDLTAPLSMFDNPRLTSNNLECPWTASRPEKMPHLPSISEQECCFWAFDRHLGLLRKRLVGKETPNLAKMRDSRTRHRGPILEQLSYRKIVRNIGFCHPCETLACLP